MNSATNQDFHPPFCSRAGMSVWFITLFICGLAYFMGAIWQCDEPWYTNHWHPKALQLAAGDQVDAIEIRSSNPFAGAYGIDTLLSLDDGNFYRFAQWRSEKRLENIGILDTSDAIYLKKLVANHDMRIKTKSKHLQLDQTTTLLLYHFKSGRVICRKQYGNSQDRDYYMVLRELHRLMFASKAIDVNSVDEKMHLAAQTTYPFTAYDTAHCDLDTAPQ